MYTYTGAGRASTRVWKRGISTTYGYNNAGDLASISYSDTTPGTTYSHDRRGRRSQAVRNGITTAITLNDAAQPLTETYTGGTLDGLAMSWAYDSSLRLQSVTAKNGATILQSATYGYDTAGRLQTVTDSPYSATYTYQANSALINTLTFTNSGAAGMVTTRVYDKLNRLQRISSVSSASSAVSFLYQYNAANQRTRATLGDGSYWVYQYDALGQVISGTHFWADGTLVAGQDFSYAFDDIGNRTSTGGRASAASTYTANRVNQYSSRTVAPYVDVLGVANPTTNVTVNGSTANRKGEYFHWPLNVANSTPQYPSLTIVSQYGATQTQTGAVYVAASTENFQHDADGNLTSDGRWTYAWDGENRLVQMIRDTDTPAGARQKLIFEYDHQGRRMRKQFFTYSGGGQEQTDTVFLYGGWNMVAELNANSSNAKVRTYVWGSDLSGSLQGAGGVGGLLKVTCVGTGTTNAFAAYDGNGNVTALVDGANGYLGARYEYGPFAELIRASRTMAKASPFRFSSKYTDDESDLLYYGYRDYNATTGRWLSRDPVVQQREGSVYAFVINVPINRYDVAGLWSSEGHRQFMEHAFGNILKHNYLEQIKEANVGLDDANEEGGDYKHAMCEIGQSPSEATERMQSWLKILLTQARLHADAGHCEVALTLLGRALHTMNDWDSPIHTIHNEDGTGPHAPREWTHLPQDQAKHSFRDDKGQEKSTDIRAHDWALQDAFAWVSFDSVFPDPCPCRRRIVRGSK
jgi:RHS repeat-associated protein